MVAITVTLTAVFAVIAIALQFIQGFIDKSEQAKVKRKIKLDKYEFLGFFLTIGMLAAILLIVFLMNK